MTNNMLVFMERVRLMNEGIIGGTGRTFVTDDGKEIEEPEEIHTFQAWKARGFKVKKGEKAITRLCIWKHTAKDTGETDDDGNPISKESMFMKESCFFSANQVEKIEEKRAV